jgi:hypothetical protein
MGAAGRTYVAREHNMERLGDALAEIISDGPPAAGRNLLHS